MPPAKSLADHRLHGTFRGDRHRPRARSGESKPPRPPAHLSPVQKKKWKELAQKMCEAGLLHRLDVDLLAVACERFSVWQDAAAKVASEGATYSRGGLIKVNPAAAVASQAARDFAAMLGELGMTPNGRIKLRVELRDQDDENPFVELMNRGRIQSRDRHPDEASLEELMNRAKNA